jgi:hypothetical protein
MFSPASTLTDVKNYMNTRKSASPDTTTTTTPNNKYKSSSKMLSNHNNSQSYHNSNNILESGSSLSSLDENSPTSIDQHQQQQQNDIEFDGLLHRDTSNMIHSMQSMNVLRKNRQLCDLILQLDDESQDIYCHQIVLACNSKFFMEIFSNYEIQLANADNNNKDIILENEKKK